MRVCLASTSPARLMLLRQAGIEPLTMSPMVDEDAVADAAAAERGEELPPDELVLLLARAKAADVAHRLAKDSDFDGIVIGGDSMFALNGRVYGKPYTPEEASRRWHEMRGATGILHSGHSVFRVSPGVAPTEATATALASVTFAADISDDEIGAYVASGEPLQVAGAFTIDSLGGAFITRVEGDPSTVVGMSLSTIRSLAIELGVTWTDLWTLRQAQ